MINATSPTFLSEVDLFKILATFGAPMGLSLRRSALDRFTDLGVSLSGKEEWKYSNMRKVLDGHYVPGHCLDRPSDELRPFVPNTNGHAVVFVNGRYREDLSAVGELPEGVQLQTMNQAENSPHFGQLAQYTDAPFTALNTALWSDGLFLALADGVVLDKPVEIIHLSDSHANGTLLAPRNLIVAGRGARASIVEYYAGCSLEITPALNLPVTEIFCAAGSNVSHLKIVQETTGMFHLGSTHAKQEESSQFTSREFALNGSSVRRELHLQLAGEGATCDLNALAMGHGNQQMDMRTRVDHLVSGCQTDELYKCILDGNSRGIFDGLIKVARDAQQTNAHQTNRNLVLSDDAVCYSIPRLEIYADDVKCSHGSTTGQLEDEKVFFLRSRGFTEKQARAMLAAAFAREIVMSVADPYWQDFLDREISGRLDQPSMQEKA